MRPIEYAKASIETMMRTYDAAKLPPEGRFHYHQGVFLSGVYKTYELCKEEKYAQYVKDWVDSVITPQGEIKSADMGQFDDMQPGILLYPLYQRTGDEKYKKVLAHLMNAIDTYPTTPEGGYFHKAWCPQEMWLDGLYMEGPLRAQYGAEFNRPEYFDEVIFQALTIMPGLMIRRQNGQILRLVVHQSSGAEQWDGFLLHFWMSWTSFLWNMQGEKS